MTRLAISADGRFVAFTGVGGLGAPCYNGAYVHDRETYQTFRIAVAVDGDAGNGPGWSTQSISADGQFVVFDSAANNLVPNDGNGREDIFLYDRLLLTGE